MSKLFYLGALLMAASTAMLATPSVPEIDPATGSSALALLLGGLVVMRARLKK